MDRVALRDTVIPLLKKLPPGKDINIPSAPLVSLTSIGLSDLSPNSRAQGRVLYGFLDMKPLKQELPDSAQLITLLRDASSGGFAVVAIKHAIRSSESQREVQAAFPNGSRVAIKEPTLSDFIKLPPLIAIDNPADFVVLSFLTQPQLDLLRGESISPAAIRSKGNELLKAGSFNAAAEAFRLAADHAKMLGMAGEQLLAVASVAECFLNLGRYEDCVDAAEEALALDPTHSKSICFKAKALIKLHLYDWASTFLASFTGSSRVKRDRLQSRARKLAEQSHSSTRALKEITGFVEDFTIADTPQLQLIFPAFAGRRVSFDSFPEVPEYVGPVEPRICPDQSFNRGRGLFATRRINKGELVLLSRTPVSLIGTDEDRVAGILQLAMKSSRVNELVRSIYAAGNELELGDSKLWQPNWITAEEWRGYREGVKSQKEPLQGIDLRAAHTAAYTAAVATELQLPDEKMKSMCRWLLPGCFINHSCVPNICKTAMEQCYYLIASRDIAAGEEIVSSYIPSVHSYRRKELERRGILCDCVKCKLEQRLEQELEEVNGCYPAAGEGIRLKIEGDSHVAEMVTKLESVLSSDLGSEEERQCLRASAHLHLYTRYYDLVAKGSVERVAGVPGAEVIMAAAHQFAAGDEINALMLRDLAKCADDRIAAEKMRREDFEFRFGKMEGDLIYRAARTNVTLRDAMIPNYSQRISEARRLFPSESSAVIGSTPSEN